MHLVRSTAMPSAYVAASFCAKVIGRPSTVFEATAPMSCSARGSDDAGPVPRQTFPEGMMRR